MRCLCSSPESSTTASSTAATVSAASTASHMFSFFCVLNTLIDQECTISKNQSHNYNIRQHFSHPLITVQYPHSYYLLNSYILSYKLHKLLLRSIRSLQGQRGRTHFCIQPHVCFIISHLVTVQYHLLNSYHIFLLSCMYRTFGINFLIFVRVWSEQHE